jgi:ribosomal protein L7Ae-like RNA K-turn-binding protein
LKSVKLPLASIKGKSKEERLEARQKAKESVRSNAEARALRSMLAIGVNAVSRALERHEVEAVLITSDVEPRLMAQHLVQLAVRQAAVIVLHGLRQFAEEKLGLKTCVLAFKVD